MSIEITPLGGTGEVGKNMTVVSFDDEHIIVDMGMDLEKILSLNNKSISQQDREKLIKIGGIPDDSKIREQDISAIILTHGHLDHIGAIGKLAHEYGDAPIYATPFTAELVKHLLKDEQIFNVENKIKKIDEGESAEINDLEVEFIPGVHSIPQNAFPAIHSEDGVVLCVGGFKIDKNPVIGDSTDYSSLKKLSNEGTVISLICSVKADEPEPTPSESHARKMLEDVMTEASKEGGLIVTAFSSHIARIKIITEVSQKVDRKPVILGKSLRKKCKTASKLELVEFSSEVKIFGHIASIRDALRAINKSREDYVIITSGHQGEPNSLLSRIADKTEPYEIEQGDDIIFSASVIPNPLNIANRELLEAKLSAQGANIHRDIHVSGHAGQPGTKELIEKTNPDHIIPFHGTKEKMKSVIKIGRKIGFNEEQLHLPKNNDTLHLGE